MGKYFSGDIEGKFWFAVQSSNDADFFGVEGEQPSELYYYFDKEDLFKINKGVKECLKQLGKNKEILDNFFKENDSYNDEMIIKYFKEKENKIILDVKVRNLLEWYARLELGLKIKKCVEEQGHCSFTAEC